MQIGFIGIGAMGAGMVRNLLQAGHAVTVWNRTEARAAELVADGAILAKAPAVAAAQELVITMLADDGATEAIALAPSFLQALRPDAIHVCMATISVALAERLTAAHQAAGRAYVSAPVFGRPPAAAAGQLFILAAGPASTLTCLEPVFKVLGQRTFVLGAEPSSANVVKVTGNFMLAAMIETLGEAFALVRKHGIAADQFLEVITNTVFPAPVYKMYGGLVASDTYEPAGFKLRLGLKDVRLAQSAADAAMVPMPLAGLLHDQYMTAIARGYGDFDWAGIARLSAEAAGLPVKETLPFAELP
ncbi:MAG: NAD(P)-dependent oxidoreductase [Gammaproteobacteria bacterium]|nr:NAD(P)-dependent oxidoreductase [Gammaproteobacteria bacterium]